MKPCLAEKLARGEHGRKLSLSANGLPSAEQAKGCVTCLACSAWPAVVFWPMSKTWSVYCFCRPQFGSTAGTKKDAVEFWNEMNFREVAA